MSQAVVVPPGLLPEVLAPPQPYPKLRRRVLVTGASGMLGTDLVAALSASGAEVFARPKSDLDITDERQVGLAFRDARPEIVVNCAAFTKVDACESDPRAFAVNADAVVILAQRCALFSARLVQISTDFVFDGKKGSPYVEDDATAPLSAYGVSKRRGEEAALRAPQSLVVRTSWLFGTGGWNFVEAIRKQIREGRRTLTVVDDQRGRPTSTVDLSEALVALLERGASGIYHFANRGAVSWFEFAREIVAASGVPGVEVVPTDSASLGRAARRPANSVLDTGKYQAATGRAIRHYREPLLEYGSDRGSPVA